jgi:hypothetical protein
MIQELYSIGQVVGTAAAINVHCGFVPRYVKLFNVTDATLPQMEWFDSMAAAHSHKTYISTNDFSSYAATGITAYAGSDAQGDGAGFTIGTDTQMNGIGDVIFYLALR